MSVGSAEAETWGSNNPPGKQLIMKDTSQKKAEQTQMSICLTQVWNYYLFLEVRVNFIILSAA